MECMIAVALISVMAAASVPWYRRTIEPPPADFAYGFAIKTRDGSKFTATATRKSTSLNSALVWAIHPSNSPALPIDRIACAVL